ncbi:MAG: hypothetical protein HY689_15870 [Chloroflexi bacterium]|nr:hypothetical protein [Chloroflexota bacterium]
MNWLSALRGLFAAGDPGGVRRRATVLGLTGALLALALAALAAAQEDGPLWASGVAGDTRFGVIVTNHRDLGQVLRLLRTPWYIDQGYQPVAQPAGSRRALKVRTDTLEPASDLRAAARAQPGSYWIIGNEPNVPGQDDRTPDEYAAAFRYYERTIRSVDPTAHLVAPEILNFDATCQGCGGFTSGREWLEGFRAAYRDRYGTEPPIDIWSIHTYDMDWTRLPMGDAALQTQQIRDYRAYLDSVPNSAGRPIWLTEFAIVWAYDGVEWRDHGGEARAYPVGAFRLDAASAYLREMLEWLTTAGPAHQVERWFLFSSHGYTDPWAAAIGGIALAESDPSGPRLTAFGEMVRRFSGRAR